MRQPCIALTPKATRSSWPSSDFCGQVVSVCLMRSVSSRVIRGGEFFQLAWTGCCCARVRECAQNNRTLSTTGSDSVCPMLCCSVCGRRQRKEGTVFSRRYAEGGVQSESGARLRWRASVKALSASSGCNAGSEIESRWRTTGSLVDMVRFSSRSERVACGASVSRGNLSRHDALTH